MVQKQTKKETFIENFNTLLMAKYFQVLKAVLKLVIYFFVLTTKTTILLHLGRLTIIWKHSWGPKPGRANI